MNPTSGTLQEFAQSVGLAALPDEQRPFSLLLASGRRFSIETGEAAMLVSLSEPVSHDASERILRAWKLAFYARQSAWPVQVSLAGDDDAGFLLVLVRIAHSDFTLGSLQQAVDHLSRWLDQLQH